MILLPILLNSLLTHIFLSIMLSLSTFSKTALVKVTKGYQDVKSNGQFLSLIFFDKSAAFDTINNSFLLEQFIYWASWTEICKLQPVDQIKSDASFCKLLWNTARLILFTCYLWLLSAKKVELCSCKRDLLPGEAKSISYLALYGILPMIPSPIPVPPTVFPIEVNDNSILPNAQAPKTRFFLDSFSSITPYRKPLSKFCPLYLENIFTIKSLVTTSTTTTLDQAIIISCLN